MSVKLVDAPLPKSSSGRKGKEPDTELVTALVSAFTTDPTSKDENGDDRPRALGADTAYDTRGKAAAEGRRYALAVAKALEKIVRVNVYSAEKDKAPYYWRIYVPLAESGVTETASK